MAEPLGVELQRLREARGLTVEELADKSGVSVSTIRKIEGGSHTPLSETIARLARPLDLSFDEVWSLQRRRG